MNMSLSSVKSSITTKVKSKAQKLYEAASPKVQKAIDDIVSQKSDDLIDKATNVICIGVLIFFSLSAVNSTGSPFISHDGPRTIYNVYSEVNNTYNYYGKEEK